MSGRASSLVRYLVFALVVGMLALAASAGHYIFERNTGRALKPAQSAQAPQAGQADATGAPAAGMGEGMSEQALSALSGLMAELQKNPTDPRTLTDIGRFFVENSEWQRAESFLSRAVLSAPSATVPRQLLGIAQYQQGKLAAAGETFAALLALEEVPEVMYNLAVIYKYSLDRQEDARHLLEQIVKSAKAGDELKAEAQKEMALEAPAAP
jgi:hypothetical protein